MSWKNGQLTQEEIYKLIAEMYGQSKMDHTDPFGVYAKPKCECGGSKVYGENAGIHSDWCPLYETRPK
jgi:hypothetical protein